ncbi:Hydrogen peroxide-inducible genes activator [Methylacidimicrobium cyclopophantes]|uniref:Hydrogen peroxide-inducible genes activator n=1 Tax=Methylacidimicrobium cyclopophantes TaxID=1041766 RepID=A0A5E6MEI9_9BACT|nr:LysR substrate-binding domain-containing protein [Methylacidimicrobium cyclopophantes]VVM06671.1 Hydrogen peroxide-inducible genes activator [Methylacidimicrobium cyclopophantes]
MEFFQLRYFLAVAEAQSFTRAAERCHVSQPSLSQQIQKLEEELEQKLFHRLGRKVLLTQAGETLFRHAWEAVNQLEAARREIATSAGPFRGKIIVGAIPTIAPYLLPETIRSFRQRHPDVEILLKEELTEHILTSILAGETELGVLALPVDDPRFIVEKLAVEPLFFAFPSTHPLARGKQSVRSQDLANEPLILLDEMHCLGKQLADFCRRHGLSSRVNCRSAQLYTIERLIATGQGISLLPAMAFLQDRKPSLSFLKPADELPTRTIAAVRHGRRTPGAATRLFLEELRLRIRTLLGDHFLSPETAIPLGNGQSDAPAPQKSPSACV